MRRPCGLRAPPLPKPYLAQMTRSLELGWRQLERLPAPAWVALAAAAVALAAAFAVDAQAALLMGLAGAAGFWAVRERRRFIIPTRAADTSSLGGLAELAPLDDPRVELHEGDVADVIGEAAPGTYAAILLDVDNGPEWASFRTNARLYADAALVRARNALASGGIFAVWSGYPADPFVRSLRKAGFVPRIEPLRERGVVRARAYIGSA